MKEKIITDVLIIGSGIAGGTAALELANVEDLLMNSLHVNFDKIILPRLFKQVLT